MRTSRKRVIRESVGNEGLAEALESVVRSLRSSRSLIGAIVDSTTKHPTDVTRALARSLATGRTLHESCDRLLTTENDRDAVLALQCLKLCAAHGGDSVANLDSVVATIHERRHLAAERVVQASTAVASTRLITWLPVACGGLLLADSPSLRHTMFVTPFGWSCLAVGTGLNLLGRVWTRRLVYPR
ncbi:MAG: type II secretion system F family protein [Acidimicrobiia bacterium]